MPTVPLPHEPNLEQLTQLARGLQRAVRAGESAALAHVAEHDPRGAPAVFAQGRFPLRAAQLVIARHYGFVSWARLRSHVAVVAQYTRLPDRVAPSADPATEFLRLACLTYDDDGPERWEQARRVLTDHPEIAYADIYTAAAVADAASVRSFLESDPALAARQGGPYAWEPLMYLAYARHDPAVAERAVLDTAAALLASGADPNAGYLWHGLPTPFTVLTGVFGEGEAGPARQPRHPHSLALARAVLDAGADANDGQALYNRMFESGNDHLELLFEYGLGAGDGGPWRARLGDALAPPTELVRSQLEWAVVHGMTDRVGLLVDHGADIHTTSADGRTPLQAAARNGHTDIVELLESRGARRDPEAPVDAFVGAALAGDRAAVDRLIATNPGLIGTTRAEHPALVVWAAATKRPAAVALLVALGFDVNARGRGDVPRDEPWETALHQATANGDRVTAELLLALGADPNLHDTRFDATPLGWARHLGHPDLEALLAPLTEDSSPTARGEG